MIKAEPVLVEAKQVNTPAAVKAAPTVQPSKPTPAKPQTPSKLAQATTNDEEAEEWNEVKVVSKADKRDVYK